ncbi:putative F-box/LRR-repeat protein 9 isoform X2 [Salvia divinorum]|uniref:F-box/LRR-repeat protein 9 isoform X2 n=1 Tax=Salvia divinorum TaxID=28513 RepID=A0ABD1HVD7_SALDI
MRRSNASQIPIITSSSAPPPPWIELPEDGFFDDEYNVMCRRTVDHSQGQLVDLTIQYFGDDALLDYIVHLSSNLKHLKLGTCFSYQDIVHVNGCKTFTVGRIAPYHSTMDLCL